MFGAHPHFDFGELADHDGVGSERFTVQTHGDVFGAKHRRQDVGLRRIPDLRQRFVGLGRLVPVVLVSMMFHTPIVTQLGSSRDDARRTGTLNP